MLQFPTGDKLMHELPSLVGNGKAELAITRQKACRTQYAQGILDKGYRNMTQHPGLQIFESPIGVDEFALPVLGHRVDSERSEERRVGQECRCRWWTQGGMYEW